MFGMACVLVNIVGLFIHRGLIPGGGGLYSEVYSILPVLSNVSYNPAESYNSRQYKHELKYR